MKKKMTDRLIWSITPHSQKRIEVSDTERVGLRFRMSPQGNASWIYQKKIKSGLRRGFISEATPLFRFQRLDLPLQKYK